MPLSLDRLPLELLLAILDYLPRSAHISLSLTNKYLHYFIKIARNDVDKLPCETSTTRRICEDVQLRRYGKRRCQICFGIFDDNPTYFRGIAPICTWHSGRFEYANTARLESVSERLSLASPEFGTCWVTGTGQLCLHQLVVNRATIFAPRCCDCEYFGHFDIDCLMRVSLSNDTPASWSISHNRKWMYEGRQPSCTIQFVVHRGTS